MISTCLIIRCLALNTFCLRSCAWRTATTTTTTTAYIHREFTRLSLQEGKKKVETGSRPTRVITSSRGLNIIIIIEPERVRREGGGREESTVRRFSTHVYPRRWREGERGFKPFLPCNYSPRNRPPLSRDESLSILHGRVWMKGKKFPAPARASARLLASHFVVFDELCSCS